jgi:hypothetical protein
MAFRIGERAAVPAPWRSFRWLRDLRAGVARFGEDFIDAIFRANVVRECDPSKAASLRRYAGAGSQLIPWVKR